METLLDYEKQNLVTILRTFVREVDCGNIPADHDADYLRHQAIHLLENINPKRPAKNWNPC